MEEGEEEEVHERETEREKITFFLLSDDEPGSSSCS